MSTYLFPRQIKKDEIQEFPLLKFEGTIHVISTPEDLEPAVMRLRKEPLLGFDTETRPVFRKGHFYPVALLQLSTASEAYLFRLNHLKLPTPLVHLLEDQNLLKLGVGLRDDIKALQHLAPFQPGGFVDLGLVAKQLDIKNLGLRSLTAIFLKHRISKSAQVSNWENPELTSAQITYAATDAWIGREIYVHMLDHNLIPEKIPPIYEPDTSGNGS